ncbi:ArnT family glycosyltransferase [Lewinella sp. LCG006]|uniref:ArnT family glycosyltransferase n=1 Tax=Lewinella sp. LCG006 TaxID=3231911 RepID=UPI00345FEA15
MKIINTFQGIGNHNILLLLIIFCFSILSINSFFKKKYNTAVFLLFVAAFLLRLMMIFMDPFLHEWDERYHALVAKNMIDTPFWPRLWMSDVLDYNYQEWCCNYTWVHKPPWFLWQMALGMKLFGAEIWAMRFPGALINTLQLILVYHIGKLLVNERVGYFAAISFAFSYFALEQVSGNMGREHVDVSFLFYLTLNLWAWIRYTKAEEKERWKWAVLIGFIAGIAVLVKWLLGLYVFGIWGVWAIVERKISLKEIGLGSLSLIIALSVFLPWQWHIYSEFPLESAFEGAFNKRHITEALENHEQLWSYYFTNNHILYGAFSWVLIGIGFFSFIRTVKRSYVISLTVAVVVVYAFFIIASTKFIAYVFMVSPIIFVILGCALNYFYDLHEKNISSQNIAKSLGLIALLLYCSYTLRLKMILDFHYHGKSSYISSFLERDNKIHDARGWYEIGDSIPDNAVFLHVNQPVEVMFYTGNLAYFWVDPKDIDKLKERGYEPFLVPNPRYPSPSHLVNDDRIKKLDFMPKQ